MGRSSTSHRAATTMTSGGGAASPASMILPWRRPSPDEQEHSNAAVHSRQKGLRTESLSVGGEPGGETLSMSCVIRISYLASMPRIGRINHVSAKFRIRRLEIFGLEGRRPCAALRPPRGRCRDGSRPCILRVRPRSGLPHRRAMRQQ